MNLSFNIITTFVARLASYFINTYMVIYLIEISSSEKFGQWMAIISYVGIAAIFELGVTSSIVNVLSRQNDLRNKFTRYIDTSLILLVISMTFIVVLFYIVSKIIKLELYFSLLYQYEFILIITFTCIGIVASLVQSIFLGIGKYWYFNIFITIINLINLLLIINIHNPNIGFILYTGIPVTVSFIGILIFRIFYVRRKFSRFAEMYQTVSEGVDFLKINILNLLQSNIDKMIIFPILGPTSISILILLERIYLPINFLQLAFKNLWPIFESSNKTSQKLSIVIFSILVSIGIFIAYICIIFVLFEKIQSYLIPGDVKISQNLILLFFISRMPMLFAEPYIPLLLTSAYKSVYSRILFVCVLISCIVKLLVINLVPTLEFYLMVSAIIFLFSFTVPVIIKIHKI